MERGVGGSAGDSQFSLLSFIVIVYLSLRSLQAASLHGQDSRKEASVEERVAAISVFMHPQSSPSLQNDPLNYAQNLNLPLWL